MAFACAGFNNVDSKAAQVERIQLVRVQLVRLKRWRNTLHTVLMMTLNRRIHHRLSKRTETNSCLELVVSICTDTQSA